MRNMLTAQLYDNDHEAATLGGAELLDDWEKNPGTTLWLDIDGPLDEATSQLLRTRLGLHTLALMDASRDRHPPKIEDFEDHTFVIYKGLAAGSDNIDCGTIQIALFVGERFLVTRHSGPSPSIERLRQELAGDTTPENHRPDTLAIRLSRLIVDRYLKILLALEPRLEVLEQRLMGEGGDQTLGELVAHKSDLTRLQRVFHYHTEVAKNLKDGSHPGFRPDQRHATHDVYEHQDRAGSLAALYYQLASDLIEGYISVSSHRLNQIMRVLTIITAIFVPLSFLAGIYGMNFENMPELHSRWGYFTLLAVMAVVATTLLLTFRRKRWL